MIYAIKCGKWVKFGRALNVAGRMMDLQIGNPYKLALLAQADWPDEFEGMIHSLLAPHHHKGEWFKDSTATRKVLELMADKSEGMALFRTICVAERCYRIGWVPPTERNADVAEHATRPTS